MVRCKRKGRPGLGYLFRLKRSPQCGGCVFTWVGGWVRRTPVVGHLGRVVPGVRRKAPKSGALSTEYPSRSLLRTSPAVPDPVRQKDTPTAVTHRPTATPPTKGKTSTCPPARKPRAGTQPRDPTQPTSPPPSLPVTQAGNRT